MNDSLESTGSTPAIHSLDTELLVRIRDVSGKQDRLFVITDVAGRHSVTNYKRISPTWSL